MLNPESFEGLDIESVASDIARWLEPADVMQVDAVDEPLGI
jgi:hypothetical protein